MYIFIKKQDFKKTLGLLNNLLYNIFALTYPIPFFKKGLSQIRVMSNFDSFRPRTVICVEIIHFLHLLKLATVLLKIRLPLAISVPSKCDYSWSCRYLDYRKVPLPMLSGYLLLAPIQI